MTMIKPTTGWFEIVEIPMYDLNEVTCGNDEYRDKSSTRVSHFFNNTWLSRYPCPQKVVVDNGSEFKQDFTPLLKDFDIKPVLKKIKNPQSNDPVERVHQVILNMLVTKNLANKLSDYIYPWEETLKSIAWAIRASYRRNIQATPGQAVFGIDIIFNLASLVDWQVIDTANQWQLYIGNF